MSVQYTLAVGPSHTCLNIFAAMAATAAPKTVVIDVGGEKIIKVKPELFSVAGDNLFASMFSERWQNELDEDGRFFVDYSPQVFVPLIEFLRLVRDSEPDMTCPVVVSPEYRRAWIRMMLVSSFHPEVLRKAGVTIKEVRDICCNDKLIKDAGGFSSQELVAKGMSKGAKGAKGAATNSKGVKGAPLTSAPCCYLCEDRLRPQTSWHIVFDLKNHGVGFPKPWVFNHPRKTTLHAQKKSWEDPFCDRCMSMMLLLKVCAGKLIKGEVRLFIRIWSWILMNFGDGQPWNCPFGAWKVLPMYGLSTSSQMMPSARFLIDRRQISGWENRASRPPSSYEWSWFLHVSTCCKDVQFNIATLATCRGSSCPSHICLKLFAAMAAMAAPKTVVIDVGGKEIIKVKPELFSVAGDNLFASMFSERWQNELDEDGRFFVDYSPQVFLPLIEFLRLVRDSEPDMTCPVVVSPEYRRAWIRMMLVSSFHPEVLRKAGVTVKELWDMGCNDKLIKDAGFTLQQLREAGYGVRELSEVGLEALLQAGFSRGELVKGGFEPSEVARTERGLIKGGQIKGGAKGGPKGGPKGKPKGGPKGGPKGEGRTDWMPIGLDGLHFRLLDDHDLDLL